LTADSGTQHQHQEPQEHQHPEPQQQPQQPQQQGQQQGQDLDVAVLQRIADLAHETLTDVLGTLGRPATSDIVSALYEVLLPYTDPDYYPGSRDRYSTLALLEGRLMVVLDHETWAWQVFVVTSPACRLPEQSRPRLDDDLLVPAQPMEPPHAVEVSDSATKE
jgi:hypothetical protein